MSSIEERRRHMIAVAEGGGYIGTLESADRYREERLAVLPNVPYFNLDEQQEFIRTNGGQLDFNGSYCGSNPNYPDGRCTLNSLEQIQRSLSRSNQPLLIPKKRNSQKWTQEQIRAFAMQNIQVKERKSQNYTDRRGTTTYNPNVVYYEYNLIGSLRGIPYYDRYLQEQKVIRGDREIGSGFQRGAGYVGDKPEVTTDHIEPQVEEVIVERPFEKPDYRDTQPEVTTDHIEPPVEEDFLPPTSQVEPPVEAEPEVTTDHIEPPVEEETQVTTSQVEPPVEEETQGETQGETWFGDTWLPWHFSFDLKRKR